MQLGPVALEDWAANLPPLTASARGSNTKPGTSLEWARLLKSDFMLTLLDILGPEPVLSVPIQDDIRAPHGGTSITQDLRFFQVVMGQEIRRKKNS